MLEKEGGKRAKEKSKGSEEIKRNEASTNEIGKKPC